MDRLHWYNHNACAEGYNLRRLDWLSWLNSETAEQCNSVLGRVKPFCSRMRQVPFMLTARLVVGA